MRERPRVGVLMGGPSAEHEISLKSGQGVAAALTRLGWNAQAMVIPKEFSVEDAGRCTRQALQESDIEAAFVALHGPFGEDGTIQAICEDLRIAYTGSDPQASRLGLDKVASRERFESARLLVPKWCVLDPDDLDGLVACITHLHFPVVVKPTNQGSSIGVSIAANHAELIDAVADAGRYGRQILVEEFVRGRELTVGILGRETLPVVEVRPHSSRFFDYAAKYTPGQTTYEVPACLDDTLTQGVQEAGLRAHRALGCRHFSRVDLILNDQHQPVILEVNTIPGLTATSLLPKAGACAGILYDELCERLILMALASHRDVEPSGEPVSVVSR